MNWDQVQGSWKTLFDTAKIRWGELTDDELDQASGSREKLERLIQEKYGKTTEEARKDVDEFMAEGAKNADSSTDN